MDAADEDIVLSAVEPEDNEGYTVGGEIDRGVGAWLYTRREVRDGAECRTGGIRLGRVGDVCTGSGVPTRDGALEREAGVCGVFDMLVQDERRRWGNVHGHERSTL